MPPVFFQTWKKSKQVPASTTMRPPVCFTTFTTHFRSFLTFKKKRVTDWWMDWLTDGWTDIPSCRDARTHLKMTKILNKSIKNEPSYRDVRTDLKRPPVIYIFIFGHFSIFLGPLRGPPRCLTSSMTSLFHFHYFMRHIMEERAFMAKHISLS